MADLIDTSKIKGTINEALDMGKVPLFAVGFIFGITRADATWHTANAPNDGYATNIQWRVKDAIGHLGIGGVSVGSGFVSVAGPIMIKPFGWVNNGLWAVLGAYFYKEMKGPYANEIAKAIIPFGVGYMVGNILDPAPSGLAPRGSGGSMVGTQAGATNQPNTRAGGNVMGRASVVN